MRNLSTEKPLKWIGSSYKDLLALPSEVRSLFGFALSLAQAGEKHDATKVLKGFGGAGVLEIIESDAHGTYRAVYTVKFEETPKEDMDIIHARLKIAAMMAEELRNAKENH
jgi:phage-related protein